MGANLVQRSNPPKKMQLYQNLAYNSADKIGEVVVYRASPIQQHRGRGSWPNGIFNALANALDFPDTGAQAILGPVFYDFEIVGRS